MSRRRKNLMLSFDSFLDIVTNVVGVMVLIAIVTVVNAAGMTVSLGMPMARPAPETSDRISLECRGNRVVRIDEDELNRLFEEAVLEHTGKTWEDLDFDEADQVPKLFDNRDIGNSFYRIKFELTEFSTGFSRVKRPAWIFEPRQAVQGESVGEFREETSAYQQLLTSLDATKHYLFFTVHPDSFEAFRAARRIARRRGLKTGWFPCELDEPLRYSVGGSIGREVDGT